MYLQMLKYPLSLKAPVFITHDNDKVTAHPVRPEVSPQIIYFKCRVGKALACPPERSNY
jgi:hypothetical protein